MIAQFKDHVQTHFPELLNHTFLVACSGGMDSVVLTYLCKQIGLEFAMAHCNFKLRGMESDGDAAFVQTWAATLGKEIHLTSFETGAYAQKKGLSIQMAARELRYDWFQDQMVAHGLPFLVTAHHADDDLETFLIHLSRGTGLKGLLGIPAKQGNIRRPLLAFPHAQLKAFAQQEQLQWREDSSNADTKYLRNKIRKELVPVLKELHPTFLDNFKTTQAHLEQSHALTEAHLKAIRGQVFQEEQGRLKISIKALLGLHPLDAYLYGVFQEFGFTDWKSLAGLLKAMSGKTLLSDTHILLKDRSFLWLHSKEDQETTADHFHIDECQAATEHPIQLRLDRVGAIGEVSKHIIYVDKNALKYPLVLRKWKNGDYFYPFGSKGKKKLAKFFKDEKVDVFSKDAQWLLCSDDAILWVIGRRMDDRFKVTEQSKGIIRITFVP